VIVFLLATTGFLGILSTVSGAITTLSGYETELFATVTSGGDLRNGLIQIDEAPNGTFFVGQDFYDATSQIFAVNPNGSWALFGSPPVLDPDAVTVNSTGIVFTGGDGYIYQITPGGASSPLPGRNFFPAGPDHLEVSPSDELYAIWLYSGTRKIYTVNSTGDVSLMTTGDSITFDETGNLYFLRNDTIYIRYPNGTQDTFLTGVLGEELEYHPSGAFITVGTGVVYLTPINGSGTVILASGFEFATDVTVASSGDIFVTDLFDIYRIFPSNNEPPVADAGPDQIVVVGDFVFFNGTGSFDPDGTIVSYQWDFDESDGLWWKTGAPSDALGPISTYIYGEEGTYTVTLWVTDNNGSSDLDRCEITVLELLPPTLHINISQDGKDVILNWDPPPNTGLSYYLIYRSISQTDFDFNTIWVNTSSHKEFNESATIPLRTIWNDTNAAFPSNNTNYEKQYYYTIRAVNILGKISSTSRTVGKWTKTFPHGVSTFSLPLEPLETKNTTIDHYLSDMKARYIKWMDPVNHIWKKHGGGSVNDTQLEVGKGYEVSFDSFINYTFTGMPSAMISYDDDSGFVGFISSSEAKNLTASVNVNGDVTLTWQQPASMSSDDWYEVYYSNTRDGFFGTFGVHYDILGPIINYGIPFKTFTGLGANDPGARLYFIVVPFNVSGIRGSSTYSIGIWTEEYLVGYDTIGIPLKQSTYKTADWYCDNIPDTVGINYYIYNQQRWGWHSTRMPKGAFDPMLEMTAGYQISTLGPTKFTFIGV
jgi:hypothetical protein